MNHGLKSIFWKKHYKYRIYLVIIFFYNTEFECSKILFRLLNVIYFHVTLVFTAVKCFETIFKYIFPSSQGPNLWIKKIQSWDNLSFHKNIVSKRITLGDTGSSDISIYLSIPFFSFYWAISNKKAKLLMLTIFVYLQNIWI
jgi:hypothetical protein